MQRLGGPSQKPWLITMAAVGGLILSIILAGLVGFVLNQRILAVADETLSYDVELEDHGDDLRVAVLDVRHYHRNLAFEGNSRGAVADFESAYSTLMREIDELEELGVRTATAPQPDELREMATEYYEGFRPALDGSPEELSEASDLGLIQLEEMDLAAQEIDKLGEQRSSAALGAVNRTATTSRFVLLGVVGGLALVGGALAYAAMRVVRELRLAYTRQEAAAEEADKASRAKTEFMADVSHELRTPLTVLRGNAEIGLQIDEPGLRQEALEDIVEESARMSRMVEDLLFLARSDSTSVPLELEKVETEPFMEALSGRAAALSRERGSPLNARLRARGLIRVDPSRLEQAILVLVDNAAKYSPEGSKVTLSSHTSRGELVVEVSDEGPGIPREDLARIFERFYRADKSRSRVSSQGGTGLGLPIARTIIEAHGGRIEAESESGGGSRMRILLPLRSGEELDEPEEPGVREATLQSPAPRTSGERP